MDSIDTNMKRFKIKLNPLYTLSVNSAMGVEDVHFPLEKLLSVMLSRLPTTRLHHSFELVSMRHVYDFFYTFYGEI